MANLSKGCGYGQVTREMVTETRTNIKEIKEGMALLNDKMDRNFNHLSSRLPGWVVILFTILGSLVVGLLVKLMG